MLKRVEEYAKHDSNVHHPVVAAVHVSLLSLRDLNVGLWR
jgi:hypothetical protein